MIFDFASFNGNIYIHIYTNIILYSYVKEDIYNLQTDFLWVKNSLHHKKVSFTRDVFHGLICTIFLVTGHIATVHFATTLLIQCE